MLNIERIKNTPHTYKSLSNISFKNSMDEDEQSLIMTNPIALDEFVKANKDIIEFGGTNPSLITSAGNFLERVIQFLSGGSRIDSLSSKFLNAVSENKSTLNYII